MSEAAVRLTIGAGSDVGKARTNNEDSFAVADLASGRRLENEPMPQLLDVTDSGILLALSDGMGGHEAGEVASALVVDHVRKALTAESVTGSLESRIEDAVKRANAEVQQAAVATNKRGMGATLTAVFVHGADAYVAEVGDSRAYLLRSGRLRQMTRDQSLVQLLVDGGVLSPEEAKKSPHKNVILQAMGLEEEVRVAIGRLKLRRGDRLMLCCDGISNALSDDEIRTLMSLHAPQGACDGMIALANDRGGEDNLTVIVAEVDGEGVAKPARLETVTGTYEIIQAFDARPGKSSAKVPVGDYPMPRAPAANPFAPEPSPESPITTQRSQRGSAGILWVLLFLVFATAIAIGVFMFARPH